jgi:hypothetical protein
MEVMVMAPRGSADNISEAGADSRLRKMLASLRPA